MTATQKGVILIIGDSVDNIAQLVEQIDPQAFGFLCYTNLGLVTSTKFCRDQRIDLSCCTFEVIHNLSESKEFLRKSTALTDFLRNHLKAEIVAVCVSTENPEAFALGAILAYRIQTALHIVDQANHLIVDPREAILVDALSVIVKEFNLNHYNDALVDIEEISSKIKSSKGKTFISLLMKLAGAYYEWDCRRYAEACTYLKEAKELIEATKDDFTHVFDYFMSKLDLNIAFLEMLFKGQPALAAIDAFFNGNRRYDAGDNLVCILTLANSIEFCLRARLLAKKYNPDDASKLNRSLLANFGDRAKAFFVEKKCFRISNFSLDEAKSSETVVTLGFSYKPGFVDLLDILKLIDDEFLKEIAPVIDTPESPAFLSVVQLNALRNKVVHKVGTVNDEDLPKAIKLVEYVIEKFLNCLAIDFPEVFPQLKLDGTESLISQASAFESYIRLNLRDLAIGMFS